LAYVFDPVNNTLIDDEDKSLGNKFQLNDDDVRQNLAFGALAYAPAAINVARPFVSPIIRKGAEVLGGTAFGTRLGDIFFSKSEDEDKKEIIPSDDQGSNIEPPKGPKFELKDVLTESIFESMRDPELRNTVKSIINEQKNFFDKKNVNKTITEKFIKSVENKAMTLPNQQNYKQPVFNKDYLNLFKNYVDQNHGGNLSKAVIELGIDTPRRTIQRRFQETNMGTFAGKESKALLDLEPGTSTYTEVMETMKSNPENIFSNINLKIKKGGLSKNSYVETIDLANLLGIDGTDPDQRNQFLKRLRKLDIRTKAGTQGGKAKKYHVGDVLSELAFYTKNERQALAGDGINYQRVRQTREFDLGLSKINSALRRNIINRLEKTDIAIPKISLAEDMGHAESVEVIEKYPNLFKGSNLKSLQTLVRQDPVINQTILVDNGYHSQNDAIYKQLKNKKINIAEANNLLKLNNERIRKIIKNEARDNPFFKNQENRIALLQIDKNGIVNADMSTVDPFYIYGNINEINPKANKISDLSEKQINAYLKNLKNQWTDGAVKFIISLKDNQGNRIYSNEDIEEFRDILELPVEKTGTTKYKFQKGGGVDITPLPRTNFGNGGGAGADVDFATQLEYFLTNEDAELPQISTYKETKNPIEVFNDIIDPRNYPYYADVLTRSGLRIGEFGARLLPATGKLISDIIQKGAFKVKDKTGSGYVQDYTDVLPSNIKSTGVFTEFLKNITPTSLEKKVGLASLIEKEEQKQIDRGSTVGPKVLADTLGLGAEVTAPIFPGVKVAEKILKSKKVSDLPKSPKKSEKFEDLASVENLEYNLANLKAKQITEPFDPATKLTRTLVEKILNKKGIQIGDKDPIDVYMDTYGEIIIDVKNLAEEIIEAELRGRPLKSFDELLKIEGFLDMPIPKNPFKGVPVEDTIEMLEKDLREKKILEGFNTKEKTKNAKGGVIR
jgi:hypothetical protein